MSMEMLERLLRELMKDVRALRARANDAALPGAVTPEAAAKLLGVSLRTLETEIRRGRIRTVPVDDGERVPLSEISRFMALREEESARTRAKRKRRRGAAKPRTRPSTQRRGRK
jgi:excisionase family DNA binding protein